MSPTEPNTANRNVKWLLWAAAAVLAAGALYLGLRPSGPWPGDVSAAQFEQVIAPKAGSARVIDVRTAAEYASGHIPGAVNVPLDAVPQAAGSWGKDDTIALYCATGSRSLEAERYLVGQGFSRVYNLAGGLVSWGGQLAQGDAPGSSVSVKTDGRPVLIEFAGST